MISHKNSVLYNKAIENLNEISSKSYLFCKNCLQSDYDYTIKILNRKCSFCGSNETELVEVL